MKSNKLFSILGVAVLASLVTQSAYAKEPSCLPFYAARARGSNPGFAGAAFVPASLGGWVAGVFAGGPAAFGALTLIGAAVATPILISETIRKNEASEMGWMIYESYLGGGKHLAKLFDKIKGDVPTLIYAQLAHLFKVADQTQYFCNVKPYSFNDLKKSIRKGTFQRDVSAIEQTTQPKPAVVAAQIKVLNEVQPGLTPIQTTTAVAAK
ncbi:hypothetical protein WDW37_08710 [Bdellovibrionota bacterium FG-1]